MSDDRIVSYVCFHAERLVEYCCSTLVAHKHTESNSLNHNQPTNAELGGINTIPALVPPWIIPSELKK
jgi:hypothetical protein